MFFETDLYLHYSLNGDPVRLSGEQEDRMGIFSEPGQEVFGGELIATEPTLRYPVALFPSMPRHQQLTVAGRTWRTRAAPRLLSDGLEAVVALELVP